MFTISITLSITIWGYPSRFSADNYAEETGFIYEIKQNSLRWDGSKYRKLQDAEAGLTRIGLFHRVKQSVSPLGTNSFMVWNKIFHAMKP